MLMVGCKGQPRKRYTGLAQKGETPMPCQRSRSPIKRFFLIVAWSSTAVLSWHVSREVAQTAWLRNRDTNDCRPSHRHLPVGGIRLSASLVLGVGTSMLHWGPFEPIQVLNDCQVQTIHWQFHITQFILQLFFQTNNKLMIFTDPVLYWVIDYYKYFYLLLKMFLCNFIGVTSRKKITNCNVLEIIWRKLFIVRITMKNFSGDSRE